MGSGGSVEGYRVVQVLPGSPLEEGGLQSYVDFIVEANGMPLRAGANFAEIVKKSVGTRLDLKVFNILSREMRDEVVVPRQDWGGVGLLGGTVRYEEFSAESDFGVRVLSVVPGSPAEVAGLVPEEDYILGTDVVTLRNIDHLASLMRQAGRELLIYIFNTSEKRVRTVTLRLQGDSAQLGIDAGTGAVHSLAYNLKPKEAKPSEPRTAEKVVDPVPIPPLPEEHKEPELLPPPPAFTASTVPVRSQKEKQASAKHVLKNPFETE